MSFGTVKAKLAGVVAIPVTPFDPDDAIDEPALVTVLNRLLDGGIEVVTPNGNTGEFYALSEAEGRTVVDLTMKTVGDRALTIVGVGKSGPDAITAARYAREAGAGAIMVHQPVHPYQSAAGWLDYHRAIAESVPELGVILYVRNPAIDGATIARLGELAPNVVAVKYAVPDPVRFASVSRDAGLDRFVWIAGLAELAAPGYFAVGATGFTSGLANVTPTLSLDMLHALRGNDFPAAMNVWARIRRFEELRAANASEHNVSVVKEALAQLGVCRREVRAPSSVLGAAARAEVAALLADWQLA